MTAVADRDLDYVPISAAEALTPVEIERFLHQLLNATASNQIMLMRLRTDELDAKIAYEKRHLVATSSEECPTVSRNGGTVAQRDDWIRTQEFHEYTAYENAKKRTRNCREYLDSIGDQVSILQTLSKSATVAYYASTGQGGH
jgi:hypothetical protein